MKHYQTTVFFLSLLILSCNNRKANNATGQKIEKDTVSKAENVVKLNKGSISDSIETEFQEFWKIFRNAVIDNDTNKIVQLTNFPFKTRGPLDSDPIINYEEEHFLKVFNAYLAQTTASRKDLSLITLQEEIKRISEPDKTYIQGDWVRVGNLEFRKNHEKWYLSFAYLEYQTIEKLNKE